MAFSFSSNSLNNLASADPRLQQLCHTVIQLGLTDFSVITGHRDEEAQNKAFAEKKSKLRWPNSKHNSYPSLAVDLLPYPTGWDKREPFYYLAGLMMSTASFLHIPLRWGGDWNQNGNLFDQSFLDLAHFEIVGG